jgi:anaerobic ribonucleoside-triphosphate reductase activating protein
MERIECAGWVDSSCDDGPGVRSVLFLQGCGKNCKGCHNRQIQEHGKGTLMNINNLIRFIEEKCCNKRITISGGEPLEQLEGLKILVNKLKEKGYEVCVYTGWELDSIPSCILNKVDFIKTGGFDSNLIDSNYQYVGSSNQHMYSIQKGAIVELNLAI